MTAVAFDGTWSMALALKPKCVALTFGSSPGSGGLSASVRRGAAGVVVIEPGVVRRSAAKLGAIALLCDADRT
jgi:hypothetical protein